MRIRNGFVSNSSSASFVLWGICNDKKFEFTIDDMDEFTWGKNKIEGLKISSGIENYRQETQFIGFSPETMKNDETLLQFKQRIVDILVNKCNISGVTVDDIKFYADAGYNG